MTHTAFIEALTAFFLALSQPGDALVAKPADPAISTTLAHAACTSSFERSSEGSYPVTARLTAGPTPIVGNVMFTFVDFQGTNRSRNRFRYQVEIEPGQDFSLTHHVGEDISLAHHVSIPEVTVSLPNGQTLTCK